MPHFLRLGWDAMQACIRLRANWRVIDGSESTRSDQNHQAHSSFVIQKCQQSINRAFRCLNLFRTMLSLNRARRGPQWKSNADPLQASPAPSRSHLIRDQKIWHTAWIVGSNSSPMRSVSDQHVMVVPDVHGSSGPGNPSIHRLTIDPKQTLICSTPKGQ